MQCKCPVCKSKFPLESLFQDAAGSEMMGLLATLPSNVAPRLLSYIGLFRSTNRDLTFDRALRLLKETLKVCDDLERLATGCEKTVEIMRKKQQKPDFKPLDNQNYLKEVLSNIPSTVLIEREQAREIAIAPLNHLSNPPVKPSKAAQAIESHNQWLDKYSE